MKYQLIKHNRTGSKQVALLDTLKEAQEAVNGQGLRFVELSYIGGFPVFTDSKGKSWSVQGQVDNMQIVCSLHKDDALSFEMFR